MYASATYGRRPPARPRHQKAQSDPGHSSYATTPYAIRRPDPAHQPNGAIHYARSPSASGSSFIEHIADPFVSHPGSLLTQYSPSTTTSPSPRSPSPQRRSSSRQGTVRAPQASGSLIKDEPQLTRSVNVPAAIAAPHPYPATWGQGQGLLAQSQSPPTPPLLQSAGMQRQGSHHAVHPAGGYQSQSHHSTHHPRPTTTHHVVHPRTRSRPPSAASHRYATTITPSMYGHGSSATSLNGGVASQRNRHAPSPPLGMSAASYYSGTAPIHTRSGSPHRSRSYTRAPSPIIPGPMPLPHDHDAHKLEKEPHSAPARPLAANQIHRWVHRPALPPNFDGQTQTRYVSMLLALDDISVVYNILSGFFAWILLAGFVLFPSTFASWKTEPPGTAEGFIEGVVNNVSLFVIAFLCTGIGACGMILLWWKWRENYVWLTNRIFLPGFLNSVAGLISTLASVYGAQGGMLGKTEKSAIFVTSALSFICGTLLLVYEFWFIRNLRLEHDREVGVELAEEHGEGVLADKKDDRNEVS